MVWLRGIKPGMAYGYIAWYGLWVYSLVWLRGI